jgi:hypothetical protein
MECPSRNTTTTEIYATVGDSYSSVKIEIIVPVTSTLFIVAVSIIMIIFAFSMYITRCKGKISDDAHA